MFELFNHSNTNPYFDLEHYSVCKTVTTRPSHSADLNPNEELKTTAKKQRSEFIGAHKTFRTVYVEERDKITPEQCLRQAVS